MSKNFDKPATESAEVQALVYSAREFIFAATKMHESRGHDGNVCWTERCNTIAFLCHALRLDDRHISQIREILAGYETRHHGEHNHAEGH